MNNGNECDCQDMSGPQRIQIDGLMLKRKQQLSIVTAVIGIGHH